MDLSLLLTGRNAMLPVGAYAATQTCKMLFPEVMKTKVGQRLLPVLPTLIGIVMALLGAGEGAEKIIDKVMLGLIAGFTASSLFKVGKTSLLGWGVSETETTPAATSAEAVPAPTASAASPETSGVQVKPGVVVEDKSSQSATG